MNKTFCAGCGKEWEWKEWYYGFNSSTGNPQRWGRWGCPDVSKTFSHPAHTYDKNTYQFSGGKWKPQ